MNHFDTNHLKKDLKGRALRGGAVMMGTQILKSVLIIGSTMMLARLLTPNDFGLVAMVASIVGLLKLIQDLGLHNATVQRAEVSHDQLTALFWVNTLLSFLIFLIAVVAAPAIARLFNEPRLTAIAVAMSVVFFLNGLAVQHRALMRRQMRFAAISAVELVSILGGITIAILLALSGAGYWALVFEAIATALITSIFVWILSGWRPGLPVRHSNIRQMLIFGGNLTGFRIVNYLARNIGKVLIGLFSGAAQLGFYEKALRCHTSPLEESLTPITRVAVTTLSRLQSDPKRYRAYYKKGILYTSALVLPIVVFLTVDAERFILTFLGQQWLSSIPIFRALALWAFAQAFVSTTRWVYLSLGRTDRQLKWGITESAIIALGCVIGARWGAIGIAVAYGATSCVMTIPGMIFCLKGSPLKFDDILDSVWRSVLVSIIAGLAFWGIKDMIFFSTPMAVGFMIDLGLYAVFYSLLWLVMPDGLQILREGLELGKDLRLRTNESRSQS